MAAAVCAVADISADRVQRGLQVDGGTRAPALRQRRHDRAVHRVALRSPYGNVAVVRAGVRRGGTLTGPAVNVHEVGRCEQAIRVDGGRRGTTSDDDGRTATAGYAVRRNRTQKPHEPRRDRRGRAA